MPKYSKTTNQTVSYDEAVKLSPNKKNGTKLKQQLQNCLLYFVYYFLLNSVMRWWMDTIFNAIDRHS